MRNIYIVGLGLTLVSVLAGCTSEQPVIQEDPITTPTGIESGDTAESSSTNSPYEGVSDPFELSNAVDGELEQLEADADVRNDLLEAALEE